MRLSNLLESEEEFGEMSIADGLDMLIDLLEEDELNSKEVSIITKMFELLDEEMEDEDDEELEEAKTLTQHSNTANKRMASFKKSPAGERIRNRIKQRKYRRKPEVKTKRRKKAARQKTCGKNQTAQLSMRGGSSYACKIKDRLRSKLMKRVSRMY
ncbi:MAG: hypothetical protein DRH57_04790 [Candidatus Cloacimonadota bacterium]|nr:MAG: hypothetical protein DRH57_04790 [Candidatus Cloacimonadota bacterium]